MEKMTIRQLRNAVCDGELIVRENNIIMQSTHDNSGKSRVELTNIMCSYDAILSLPVERLDYDSGKFIAINDDQGMRMDLIPIDQSEAIYDSINIERWKN